MGLPSLPSPPAPMNPGPWHPPTPKIRRRTSASLAAKSPKRAAAAENLPRPGQAGTGRAQGAGEPQRATDMCHLTVSEVRTLETFSDVLGGLGGHFRGKNKLGTPFWANQLSLTVESVLEVYFHLEGIFGTMFWYETPLLIGLRYARSIRW